MKTQDEGTKKEQILTLYSKEGLRPETIGEKVGASPSYVARVLQEAGYNLSYFDLYTSTQQPMNIYSRLFANRLGFKTRGIAQRSVKFLDRWYHSFKKRSDRMGQHHALVVGLTMFNRARWMGKREEASVFHDWLIKCLNEDLPALA